MTVDISTANVLLALGVTLQAWIVRELFKLKTKVSIIIARCNQCPHNTTTDTDQIN